MWEIIDRSTFDLSGFFEAIPETSRPGEPGDAGKPGEGGRPGKPAPGCTPRTRSGPEGVPNTTEDLANWNLGRGSLSAGGKDGTIKDESLDTVSRQVFNDPTVA